MIPSNLCLKTLGWVFNKHHRLRSSTLQQLKQKYLQQINCKSYIYIYNYGKSQFFMGKFTINDDSYHSYISLPEGIFYFYTMCVTGWWFGTWILWLSIYWGCHDPNWLSFFFRGVQTTNQYIYIYIIDRFILNWNNRHIYQKLKQQYIYIL